MNPPTIPIPDPLGTPTGAAASGTPAPGPKRRVRSVVFFVIGLGLIAAAIWAALKGTAGGSQQSALLDSLKYASRQPWPLQAVALLLPIANWVLISANFWILTNRYGRVAPAEMAWLTGSSWLLNYLPMKAGMIGRIAYHRTVNGIAFTDSVRALAYSVFASAIATAIMLLEGIIITPAWTHAEEFGLLVAPVVALLGIAAAVRRPGSHAWRFPMAVLMRYLDVIVWLVRYYVVFKLIGQPISFGQAAAVAGVCQAVLVIPFSGNGIGLREWAVGLAASSLPSWFGSSFHGHTETGISADLVNRAADIIISLVVGLVSVVIVGRTLARFNRSSPSTDPHPAPARTTERARAPQQDPPRPSHQNPGAA